MRKHPQHLVIPDCHARPDVSNERFDWLGELIVDRQPDTVIQIGDFADMKSLCSYENKTLSSEGRRYTEDIDAANDALDRLMAPLLEYNNKRKWSKHKQYWPRLLFLEGNHGWRIERARQEDPRMADTIGIHDIKFKKHGWEVYRYQHPVVIDGVMYSHNFPAGNGRPISGKHLAHSLIAKHHMSCTQGHTHFRDLHEEVAGSGQRIIGLVAGCYFDHVEEYAGPLMNEGWWRGVVLKHDVDEGEYEPEFISLDYIRRKYG